MCFYFCKVVCDVLNVFEFLNVFEARSSEAPKRAQSAQTPQAPEAPRGNLDIDIEESGIKDG